MRSKLSIILDTTVLFLVLWLLFFAWIRFYSRQAVISAILGGVLAFLITFLVYFLNKKHSIKITLDKKERDTASKIALNLNYTSLPNILNYFKKILSKTFYTKKLKNALILTQKTAQNDMHSTTHNTVHNTTKNETHASPTQLLLPQQTNLNNTPSNSPIQSNTENYKTNENNIYVTKALFVPYFKNSEVSLETLSKFIIIAKNNNINKIIFCANDIQDDARSFAEKINNIKIEFWDFFLFYQDYAKSSAVTLPEVIDITKPKMKYKELLAYAFNSARARNYLLFGLLIILSSFLVPFKIYYLISGSILCIIALIIKVYPLIKR